MEKMTPEEVRKEILSAIEQKRRPTIDWVTYEKSDLGDNWRPYCEGAKQLEREGLVELRGHSSGLQFRRRS